MRQKSENRLFTLPLIIGLLCLSSSLCLSLELDKPINQYSYDEWTADQGLPDNTVNALAQTPDGYIWLGTPVGLVRFDGVKFKFQGEKDPTASHLPAVNTLLVARDGSLWAGTFEGVLHLKDGRIRQYKKQHGLLDQRVKSIFEDRLGHIWIGTSSGGVYRLKEDKFTEFSQKDGLSSNIIRDINEDREGNILVATSAGINRFNGKTFVEFKIEGRPIQEPQDIFRDKEGALWFSTSGGVYCVRANETILFNTENGLTNNRATLAYQEKEESVWIATEGGGLNRIRNGQISSFTQKDGLANNHVRAVVEDKEGSLWIGTAGGGLSRLSDRNYYMYSTRDGLADNDVRVIYEDKDGTVWCGTINGLSRFKDGEFHTYTTADGLSSNYVNALFRDSKGLLWVGTHTGGVSFFDNGRFRPGPESLRTKSINKIYEDSRHSIWVGTSGGGLHRIEGDRSAHYTTKDGLLSDDIREIYEDRQGRIWVGTNKGLNRFDGERIISFKLTDLLHDNIVTTVYEDSTGVIWIATKCGMLRMKGDRFTAYTTGIGLPDGMIHNLFDDQRGNFWIHTNTGFSRLNISELNAFADGTVKAISSYTFQREDPRGNYTNNGHGYHKGYKGRDGKFWFPTIQGVILVNPITVKANQLPPTVLIEDTAINKIRYTKESNVRPFANGELEIHFTALSFIRPEKVFFKYKLEGYDKDWVDAGIRRVAFYTNLPPGDYSFKVIACNEDGIWNTSGATLSFYLAPRFYQTGWFYALLVALLGLLFFAGHRIRIHHLKQREKVLARRVQEEMSKVKYLRGLLPICSSCKNIRDDQGYWAKIESYISKNTDADLTHSICPDCAQDLYPGHWESILAKQEEKV
jgi:ligand-binding sensor domain-containing protein